MRMSLSMLCLILLGSGCTDRIESAYASMDEAVAAGAVERGWVPGFLPSSSTQIREIHDLDTNEVWLRFNYSREDHESFVGELSAASASALQSAPLRDPGVDVYRWRRPTSRPTAPSKRLLGSIDPAGAGISLCARRGSVSGFEAEASDDTGAYSRQFLRRWALHGSSTPGSGAAKAFDACTVVSP